MRGLALLRDVTPINRRTPFPTECHKNFAPQAPRAILPEVAFAPNCLNDNGCSR
jgi:hypothetical protein